MPESGNHDAPGLLAATELQFTRALYWLAESPAGALIGLETGDDVVVAGAGLPWIREQDKNTVAENAPLTDRSVPLWKTLAIWSEAERLGQLTETTILILCTNRIVSMDCLVVRLHHAQLETEIDQCVAELQAIAARPSATIASFCAEIAQDWSAVRRVIKCFQLCDARDFDPSQIVDSVAGRLHLSERIAPQLIVDGLAGWLRRYAYERWQNRQPAWIPRKLFDNQYHAYLDLLKRRRLAERPAWDIPVATSERTAAYSEFFFEQLIAIELSDEGLEAAVDNYLRFRAERLRLSDEGDITDEDWRAFFSALVERWSRIRRRESLRGEAADVDLGRAVYNETVEAGHREHLAGTATESEYMTSGGYHRLADDKTVHWHPRYGLQR